MLELGYRLDLKSRALIGLRVQILPPQSLLHKGARMSKIYDMPENKFRELIQASHSYSDVLRKLSLTTKGGNSSRLLKKRIQELNIDITHFERQFDAGIRKLRKPLSSILIEDSSYRNMKMLKRRLVNEGLLEYRCYQCGNEGMWLGKELSLQLDHINGNHFDNRLTNLRFLCPNCHSQTETFAGKNSKHRE